MQFTIEHAPVFSTLRVALSQGERLRAEPGAMLSMSASIELQAKSAGKGLLGTLKAAAGGESVFASMYEAKNAPGELILAPGIPGDIVQLELSNQTIMAQSGAYLAGSEHLVLSAQGSLKALVSGEGLFLAKISGTGTVFLSSYGSVYQRTLATGEAYVVDSGHMVAFTEGMQYSIKTAAKGIFSSLASGEGLACLFTGPGTVWMQTRNLGALASILKPFLPSGN